MILIHTKNIILAGFTLGFLAACSGSTTTNGTGPEGCVLPEVSDGEGGCYIPTGGGVTTGTDGDISSNGLAFADGTSITKQDIDGTEMTLRALKLVRTVGGETTTLSAELVDATVEVVKDSGWNVTVNFDGETATFNLNAADFTSSYGITYAWVMDPVTDNIYVIKADDIDLALLEGDEDRYYRAYAGYETDPDELAVIEAVASYVGEFDVLLMSSGEVDLAIDGDIALTADFAEGSITGSLTNGDVEVADDLTVEFSGDILGNGWNATIDEIIIDADDDFSLVEESGGQLDGVFYGQDGEETAGTIIIDATLTNGVDDDYDWVGGGGFVACETVNNGTCLD